MSPHTFALLTRGIVRLALGPTDEERRARRERIARGLERVADAIDGLTFRVLRALTSKHAAPQPINVVFTVSKPHPLALSEVESLFASLAPDATKQRSGGDL